MSAMSGSGPVEAGGAVADQADLGVQAFEAAVGEPEADRGEDAVAVLAQRAREPDERLQPEREAQASQAPRWLPRPRPPHRAHLPLLQRADHRTPAMNFIPNLDEAPK